MKDKGVRKENDRHAWTSTDDTLLKSIVDRYSSNWQLISESFNSARRSTPSDIRTIEDCQDRWKTVLNPERKLALSEASHVASEDASTSANPNQMTTRGVKKNANPNTSGFSAISSASTTDARKRKRHTLLAEAIKKAVKKRSDAAQKACKLHLFLNDRA